MSLMPLGLLSFSAGGGAGSGNALTLISTQILASATSSITFSSIPGTYKHLQLRIAVNSTATGADIELQCNSDTASNYSMHWILGAGSSVTSGAVASFSAMVAFGQNTGLATTATTAAIIDILDYTSTSKYKTMRSLAGATVSNEVGLYSGFWRSTAAITSLTVKTGASTYVANSRFSLYGVA
jgi:hypothetical protein